PGRRHVDGHDDIFDMVDIYMFTVIALIRMVLQLGGFYEEENVGRTEVPVSKEADVGRTKEYVVKQVTVEEVVDGSFEEDVEQDEANEIVEPNVDVNLFGQVLVVGLDSNNGIYPLACALVEAEILGPLDPLGRLCL
nr:hypothetical protein [Tanacetum cinerariifolium]